MASLPPSGPVPNVVVPGARTFFNSDTSDTTVLGRLARLFYIFTSRSLEQGYFKIIRLPLLTYET
jgi:hypothetical protein